jgi:hypothetical protein
VGATGIRVLVSIGVGGAVGEASTVPAAVVVGCGVTMLSEVKSAVGAAAVRVAKIRAATVASKAGISTVGSSTRWFREQPSRESITNRHTMLVRCFMLLSP